MHRCDQNNNAGAKKIALKRNNNQSYSFTFKNKVLLKVLRHEGKDDSTSPG